MYDYLDDRQTKRLKELVPYEALAPDADEIIEELDRLNNIIEELEKWCNECIDNRIIAREHGYNTISDTIFEIILDKLKELKENNNEK